MGNYCCFNSIIIYECKNFDIHTHITLKSLNVEFNERIIMQKSKIIDIHILKNLFLKGMYDNIFTFESAMNWFNLYDIHRSSNFFRNIVTHLDNIRKNNTLDNSIDNSINDLNNIETNISFRKTGIRILDYSKTYIDRNNFILSYFNDIIVNIYVKKLFVQLLNIQRSIILDNGNSDLMLIKIINLEYIHADADIINDYNRIKNDYDVYSLKKYHNGDYCNDFKGEYEIIRGELYVK